MTIIIQNGIARIRIIVIRRGERPKTCRLVRAIVYVYLYRHTHSGATAVFGFPVVHAEVRA